MNIYRLFNKGDFFPGLYRQVDSGLIDRQLDIHRWINSKEVKSSMQKL